MALDAAGTSHESRGWPTPTQQLLVAACFLTGEAGRRSWHSWYQAVDMMRLDSSSDQVLSALFRNLRSLGVETPVLGRLKGIHHHSWTKNQVAIGQTALGVGALTSAGVPSILLDGSAWLVSAPERVGAYSIDALDILVPTNEFAAAVDVLESAGWQPQRHEGRGPVFLLRLLRGAQTPIHLHRHALRECDVAAVDERFWKHSEPAVFGGVATRTLGLTDQLMRVCAEAATLDPARFLLWLLDATALLTKYASSLDWDHLVRATEEWRLTIPIRARLRFLARRIGAPVPRDVLTRLEQAVPSYWERLTDGDGNPGVETRLGLYRSFGRLWLRQLRANPGVSGGRRLLRFPAFLQDRWGTQELWRLPAELLRQVSRELPSPVTQVRRGKTGLTPEDGLERPDSS